MTGHRSPFCLPFHPTYLAVGEAPVVGRNFRSNRLAAGPVTMGILILAAIAAIVLALLFWSGVPVDISFTIPGWLLVILLFVAVGAGALKFLPTP